MLQRKKNLTPVARGLRQDMTPQERRLWYEFLRNHPLKFYRQRVIDSFIVDFYCSKANLIVELDGSQHDTIEGRAHDGERTAILETLGLQVIRFSNFEVDNHFEDVCRKINEASLSPPLKGELAGEA